MGVIKSFEDLEVWQRARKFSLEIYNVTIQGTFEKDYSLRNQINESSGSIMDNIAEGFERNGSKELIQFLSYAKASAGETRSQLYRAFDRRHISEEKFVSLKNEALEISKMISGLISYVKRSEFKGSKFKEPLQPYNGLDIDNNFEL